LNTLPTDSKERKDTPLATGCFDYFALALAAVARLSKYGNDKHNPGQPLHWDREKSTDHADCIARHLIERGKIDPDSGLSHTAALAWRSLALLQIEEEERIRKRSDHKTRWEIIYRRNGVLVQSYVTTNCYTLDEVRAFAVKFRPDATFNLVRYDVA
jgi:hypothetical protein